MLQSKLHSIGVVKAEIEQVNARASEFQAKLQKNRDRASEDLDRLQLQIGALMREELELKGLKSDS